MLAAVACKNQVQPPTAVAQNPKEQQSIRKELASITAAAKSKGKISQAQADSTLQAFDQVGSESLIRMVEFTEAVRAALSKPTAKELAALKSKFTYSKSDFNTLGVYEHKRWGNTYPDRNTLVPTVASDSSIWFSSNYHSTDWIFHTSVTLLVGDLKMETETVETYDDSNHTFNSGGEIWESVSYLHSGQIVKCIAENTDKVIKVRFNGKKMYDEITLSAGDKQGIKEAWELSQAL